MQEAVTCNTPDVVIFIRRIHPATVFMMVAVLLDEIFFDKRP